jgi:hypothetical protein
MNKVTKSIVSGLGFILVLAIATSWTAPHVIAQIKAALVQDIDNPARHVWTFANYNNSTYTVPAGQTLVIEEIGGLTGNSFVEIAIDESNVTNRGSFWFSAATATGAIAGALSETTRIYVRGGQTFVIRESPNRGDLISLHGHLISD